MQLIQSQTFQNLARAYAGECMARTRYEFIEYGARNQGLNALADLIDKVVYNEFNHARMFYTYIQKASDKPIDNIEICAGYPFKEKWDLTENLLLAAGDEEREETIYASFADIAKKEGFPDIETLFRNVQQVENCHKLLFTELHDQLKNGTMYRRKVVMKWKCCGCGYEAESKEAWQKCPLCGATQGFVMLHVEDGAC